MFILDCIRGLRVPVRSIHNSFLIGAMRALRRHVYGCQELGNFFHVDSLVVSSMQSKTPAPLARWAWWLLPLLVFSAVAATFGLLSFIGPSLPFILLVAVLALGVAWILASSISPSEADRTCPECQEHALERLDPNTTRGVICSHCGHIDRDISSWYLAEEETTLEEIVLAERAQKRTAMAQSQDTTPNTESSE